MSTLRPFAKQRSLSFSREEGCVFWKETLSPKPGHYTNLQTPSVTTLKQVPIMQVSWC